MQNSITLGDGVLFVGGRKINVTKVLMNPEKLVRQLTTSEFNAIVKEVIAEAESAGLTVPTQIEYTISTRMTRALGNYSCKVKYDPRTYTYTDTNRRIAICADLPLSIVKNTLMHEILHAVAGVKAGHGYEWQKVARIVNRCLGYNIQRLASPEESRILRELRTGRKAETAQWMQIAESLGSK